MAPRSRAALPGNRRSEEHRGRTFVRPMTTTKWPALGIEIAGIFHSMSQSEKCRPLNKRSCGQTKLTEATDSLGADLGFQTNQLPNMNSLSDSTFMNHRCHETFNNATQPPPQKKRKKYNNQTQPCKFDSLENAS